MQIKGLQDEDFVNYKKPSLYIGTAFCDWKCCTEQHINISECQNSALAESKIINISEQELFERYINNPLTKAVVIGGLEPMLQIDEIIDVIQYFRNENCNDDFVIYTGYYPNGIEEQIKKLKQFPNIIVKFGRYIPGRKKHFDSILGVYLVSENQFAEKI